MATYYFEVQVGKNRMPAVICEAEDDGAALAEADSMLEDSRKDDPSESVTVTVYGPGAVLVGKRYWLIGMIE